MIQLGMSFVVIIIINFKQWQLRKMQTLASRFRSLNCIVTRFPCFFHRFFVPPLVTASFSWVRKTCWLSSIAKSVIFSNGNPVPLSAELQGHPPSATFPFCTSLLWLDLLPNFWCAWEREREREKIERVSEGECVVHSTIIACVNILFMDSNCNRNMYGVSLWPSP